MPVFEYRCKKCGNEFEELVLNQNEKVKCPSCSSDQVEKKMSVFAHKSSEEFRASSSSSSCVSCSTTSCPTCSTKS